MDFSFGYGGESNGGSQTPQGNGENGGATNIGTGAVETNPNGEPAADLDDPGAKNGGKEGDGGDGGQGEGGNGTKSNEGGDGKTQLTPGTTLEFDNQTYTVAENGDILDSEGKVFKAAADVDEWMKGFDIDNNDDSKAINLANIQKALDVEITDENDKPVEYENSIEGIKSYVNDVIETSREEHYEAAINTLFAKYPFMSDMINYYEANGQSLEGYSETKDRSNIELDANNVEQQETIIKTAWEEQGRKGDVKAYIEYLKSNGTLATVAQEELDGLKEADAEYREQMEKEAKEAAAQREEDLINYWLGVKEIIDSKQIAGYKIPDNIVITRNGQKMSVTPTDFFNYLYRVDSKGNSQYTYDLAKQKPESKLNDEILRAYLTFVGGNYSNLVDMAINDKEVAKLKLSAKQNNKPKVTVKKPNNNNGNGGVLDLGYI